MFFIFCEFRSFVCIQNIFQDKGRNVEDFPDLFDIFCIVKPVERNPGDVIVCYIFFDARQGFRMFLFQAFIIILHYSQ